MGRPRTVRVGGSFDRSDYRWTEYAGLPPPGILPGMKRKKRKKIRPPEGYVLPPGVTHPQGRPRAFVDAMKVSTPS